MAVLDAVPGVEVSILINGQPVQEYDTNDEVNGPLASKTVVKYIEAVSDAEFAINYSILASFEMHNQDEHDLIFEASVDGICVDSLIWEFEEEDLPWTCKIEGVHYINRHGVDAIKHFKLAAVKIAEVTDGKKIEADAETAQSLGEVTVDVFRGRIGDSDDGLETASEKESKGAISEISEKAVKGRALSHGTIFGREEKTEPLNFFDFNYLDDTPIMRFIFYYRSKEALRKLLVIPRSPSPDPFEALSAEEIQSLAREAFGRRQGTKQEPGIKSESKIKRERSPSSVNLTEGLPRRKLRKTSTQILIDLTDD